MDDRRVRRVVRIRGVVHRSVRVVVIETQQVPCAVCGRVVEAVTWGEAAALIGTDLTGVDALISSGRVHWTAPGTGAPWICRDSLFGG